MRPSPLCFSRSRRRSCRLRWKCASASRCSLGYVISSLVVIPLVTHGITFISRFQLWTQPIWIVLQLLPFVFIAADRHAARSTPGPHFTGAAERRGQSFNILLFGTAATVVFSLIAQIGEQVDFLRFLPARSGTAAS